ncbi:MAG TPA: carbon monoxide dehydrogenase, partial [Thermoanaerobaculia bacterium]
MEPRTSAAVSGMGHSMKRKEDPRFIRGQGHYIDDLKLPGMVQMDIVRSPYAHAKIKAIHTEKALAVPGVLAVITGETLKGFNLHWMPTLMSDTQMVLPVEKVMYQAQEVAAVIATDRYTAADGVDAVEVEYEPLPVIVDPKKSLEPGAQVLRTDKKDKKDNHIWHWEAGDRQGTDKAFADADVVVRQEMHI